MPKFEVAIYNQEVCDEIAKGENHSLYDNEWADLHFIEVSAENEEGAKSQLQNRYPTEVICEGYFVRCPNSLQLLINR